MKVCSTPGCHEIQSEPRCLTHRQAKEQARGSRHERGYDSAHVAHRNSLAPLVATGNVKCWRCGEYIASGQPWDDGHDDTDRTKYRGPEHVGCNRATAGR